MQLEHEFTVPVGVSQAWAVLLDVERVAPCMPGATLDAVEGDTFTGRVKVKLGPINLTYKGEVKFAERDEGSRRVVLEASGKETRGSGTAKATVTATLSSAEEGTTVRVLTDLAITGRPAQFGRGMLQDVGGKLIDQFATCLADTLSADDPAAESSSASPSVSPAPESADRRTPEAIDLLEVTGATSLFTRYRRPLLITAAVATLIWLLARRRSA